MRQLFSIQVPTYEPKNMYILTHTVYAPIKVAMSVDKKIVQIHCGKQIYSRPIEIHCSLIASFVNQW